MGQMLCILGRRKRQTAKLKSLLDLTVSRLAVLRNQRRVRCTNARSDVTELLLAGQQNRALLRAEQVIKEQNMLDAFVIIESYCHLLTERASFLERLKQCPDELREAISGVIFAASRCGDLPELRKVRYMFGSKFGREFTNAALELRNNCGVNPKLIQNLSTRQPCLERKISVTKEIATEKGIVVDIEEHSTEVKPVVQPLQYIEYYQPCTQEVNPNLKETKSAPNPTADFAEMGQEKFCATQHKYKDATTAAQAAFELAAYAAAAAKVAVKLSRSESQGKGPDDWSTPGSSRRTGFEDWKEDDEDLGHGSDDENAHPAQNYSFESEEEDGFHSNKLGGKPVIWMDKSRSDSSLDSSKAPVSGRKSSFATSSSRSSSGYMDGRKTMLGKSDDEIEEQWCCKWETLVTGNRVLDSGRRSGHGFKACRQFDADPDAIKIKTSYPKGNTVRYREELHSLTNEERDEMGKGLRSGDGDYHVNSYSDGRSQSERIYPDNTEKVCVHHSNVRQRSVSVRTRREL